MYLWEKARWPGFTWGDGEVLGPLAEARYKQGRLLGGMVRLGFDLRLEAQVHAVTEDVLKSSEIEGEFLDRESVRSSVARRLGQIRLERSAYYDTLERTQKGSLDVTAWLVWFLECYARHRRR